MLKVVHISDFHLNNANLEDWNAFIKPAFINLMKQEFPENKAIIICTGDLLDQGGKDFGGIKNGLQKFKESVIIPVTEELEIPTNHFICIPGNHDIDRFADDKIDVKGLISVIRDGCIEDVNEYIKTLKYDSPGHSKRVSDYKSFEKELYGDTEYNHLTFVGSSFRIKCGETTIGIAGFNTVWNCSDDNDKDNGICISEPQYIECTNFIKDCDYKIALMHHPLDWLEKENESIQAWIKTDYNILLDGHVHSSDTSIITNVYGSLFIDTAPAFENDIRGSKFKGAFSNGVSIITVDDDKTEVKHKKCKYVHKTRTYSSESEDILNYVSYSSEEEKIINKCIKFIKNNHYDEYDNSIIPHKAEAIKTLSEAFVLPPITKNGSDKDRLYTIGELLNDSAHIVLFGSHESGKTTLLYRMIIELVDNHHVFQTIPVYIDFENIGNRDIETCIKSYLDCNSSELAKLLDGNFITLFIDNYSPNESNKHICNKLNQFAKDNYIRIIATSKSDLNGSFINSYTANNPIAFENYNIKPFNAENIRQLMIKWSPGGNFEDTNTKIQRMVSSFCSYSLPCTAMSVSLYLWSTESSSKKPMNPALLLDIYLEIILEKLNNEYIYRDSFDYENKIMILASIAKTLHDKYEQNQDYQLTYPQYLECIITYLKTVGFEKVEADKLGNYFIDQKVFIKQGNNVIFSHSCFYYFLLAKRMERDRTFRAHVLSKENYYKYEHVIDYYAGLNRSDRELLQDILDRFNEFFHPLDEVMDEIDHYMDDCFTNILQNDKNFTPIINRVELHHANKTKGTQGDVEKRANEAFDEKISRIADNYTSPNILYPELLIVMLCKALRNLDGVEDVELKSNAYEALIKKSLGYTLVLKENLARYANLHSGNLPIAFSSIDNIPHFLRYMPFGLQCTFHEIMGSTKLFTPIKNKIDKDRKNKSISDIEKYFSIALLWDSTGAENEKEIKKLISSVGNNCVLDYIFNKIYYRFINLVSVGSEEEEKCIDLLAELQVKGQFGKWYKKGQIMNKIRKERENYFKQLK